MGKGMGIKFNVTKKKWYKWKACNYEQRTYFVLSCLRRSCMPRHWIQSETMGVLFQATLYIYKSYLWETNHQQNLRWFSVPLERGHWWRVFLFTSVCPVHQQYLLITRIEPGSPNVSTFRSRRSIQNVSFRTFRSGRSVQDVPFRTFRSGRSVQDVPFRTFRSGRSVQDIPFRTSILSMEDVDHRNCCHLGLWHIVIFSFWNWRIHFVGE